jgi:3-methyladenine DNA glycosylase AlkD
MKINQQELINATIERVLTLSEERAPFAKLDKISHEIGKSFIDTPETGFKLVERLWQEIKNYQPKSIVETLKLSAVNIVLANILGILGERDFKRVLNLIERYNIEGGRWYITDNLATRAVRICYGTSQKRVAEKVAIWINSNNKWQRRLGVVSALIGVKYCNMEADWCLDILQKVIPESEQIVNKAIAWTLRELSRKYPDKIRIFIEQYKDSKDRHIKYIVKYGRGKSK